MGVCDTIVLVLSLFTATLAHTHVPAECSQAGDDESAFGTCALQRDFKKGSSPAFYDEQLLQTRSGTHVNHSEEEKITLLQTLRFETSEHQKTGDSVKLTNGYTGGLRELELSSGFKLSYGDILSLCGDFYGKKEIPICEATSPDDAESRFQKSYECMDIDKQDPKRVFQWATSNWDATVNTFDMPCTSYLFLAQYNMDHFAAMEGYTAAQQLGGLGAKEAYGAGHRVACKSAAKGTKDEKELNKALAMNACASHYLSDLFAPGHLRTPRRFVYDYSSKWMHDEDNTMGLNVTNKRGDKWRAYGDKCHEDPKNKRNDEIELETITASAEAVLKAWETGDSAQCIDDAGTMNLVPDIAAVQDASKAKQNGNSAPLFVVQNNAGTVQGSGELYKWAKCRADSCDMTTYDYDGWWTTATTGAKLHTCTYAERTKKDTILKSKMCKPNLQEPKH